MSEEIETIRTRALQAAQYYHKSVIHNGEGTPPPPQHPPPPQDQPFRRTSKDTQRSSMRVNGTVHSDALRAGVTPNSEHPRLLMKSRGQEYGSNMRLGEYRPPANQSSEHKRSPAATPTGDHRITPQTFEGAMTHTTSSYSSTKSTPRQNSSRTGSRNSESRQSDRTVSAFTPVQRHPKDSRRNEHLRTSNTPGGHSARRHNTSPENRYDLLSRTRQEAIRSGALTTDNINRHVRKEYFKGDFPVRRSNSNSTLNDALDRIGSSGHLDVVHRGYGSTSSIDMQSVSGESFFQMLQKFGTDIDQRSPAPPQLEKLLGGGHVTFAEEVITHSAKSSKVTMATAELRPATEVATASPKLSRKGTAKKDRGDKEKEKTKVSKTKSLSTEKSIFSKLRSKGEGEVGNIDSDLQSKIDERFRQKAFAHYDCQSINVNLNEVIRNRQHGWKRKNTTTGASAASRGSNSNTPQGSREDLSDEETADFGDGKSNDLVMSCPFFRNEIGGEAERKVNLSRASTDDRRHHHGRRGSNEAILEGPKVRLSGGSPGSPDNPAYLTQPQIERIDYGAHYYRDYFFGQEHQNYLGIDENLGPVAVSIKRERLEDKDVLGGSTNLSSKDNNNSVHQYRVIVRTSELTTLRGSILEEAIPSSAKHSTSRGLPLRDVLEYIAPELQLSCLRLAVSADKVQEQLMKLDEQGINNKYKVGVMYCKAGQSTEEEMYNNEHAGPAFEEFLKCLGETVRLQGFDKYRAQLDNKSDSTGTHSLYTTYQNNEIMFHVSTMLPYTPNNKQQLLRKRHIGNDIVTIVFQEEGAAPFTPKTIRSHFQHVFILVQAHHPNTDNLHYSVAVSRSKDVPSFGPPLPEPPTFQKSKIFTDFVLAKIINAENAVHRSEKFVTMAVRTRQEYLRDLANNSVSNATIDTGAKFGKFILWDKKKEKNPPKVVPENITKGAIVWKIQVADSNLGERIDASLGISAESVVLIEDEEQEPIFSVPSKSIIGWTSNQNSIKLYYNEGECIVIYCADNDMDEVQAVVNRLDLVTDGCETNEITLRRNGLGQLGFHVHYQGLVAEVEQYGFAWQAGLRKGSRLVEICKVAVCTLTHDQMIDLLRTSMTVKVVIIPPHEDGTPRRGVPTVELTGSLGNYLPLEIAHRSQGSKVTKLQPATPYITERDVSPHSRASSSPASILTGSKLTPPRSDRKHRPPPDYSASKRDNLPPSYNEVRAVVAKLEQKFNAEEEDKRREERAKSDSSYRGKHRQTSSERSHRTHHDGDHSSVQDTGKASRELDVQFARESHERQSGRNSKNQRHVQNMQAYANRHGLQDPQFVNRAAYHDAKQTNAMSRLPLSCSAASAFAEAEKRTPLTRHATSMSVSSGDTSLTSTSTSNSTGASDDKWYDTGDELHDGSFTHDDPPKEGSTDTGYDNISHDTVSHDTISHDTYDSIQSSYSNSDVPERPPSDRHTYTSVDNLMQSNHKVATTSYLHKTYPPRDRDLDSKQPLPIQSENSAFDRPLASLTNLSDTSTHSGSSTSNRSRQGYHSQVHSLTRSPQLARRKLHAASPEIRDVMKKRTSSRDTDSPLSGRVSSSESLTSRLRPGATPRSAHKQQRSQTSTVKEDLLKLITPDITEMEVKPVSQPRRTGTLSPSLPAYSRLTLQRTLSDESLSGGGTTRKPRRDPTLDITDNLVFTSTQKSTFPSRMIAETTNIAAERKERNVDKTVVSGNTGGSIFPLPDQGSGLEWSSLVETAKSFEGLDMQSIKSASVGTLDEIADTIPDFDLSSSPEQYNGPSRKIRSGGEEKEAEFSESDLRMQLLHLTRQLSKERNERKALEAQVDQLKEDNVRLQDESQTAAAQLRKFTEWFFNTIDRQ